MRTPSMRLPRSLTYLDLPHSLTVPIWREGRVVREVLAARRLAPPVPAPDPRDVLLVAGFLDGGHSLEPLAARLELAGHRVHRANIGRNVDCTERMAERLEARLEEVAAEAGGPVVLVGHSRGGVLSRVVAVRRPASVAAVVAVGSPLSHPHDIALPLRLIKLGMHRLSHLGVQGLIRDCMFDGCCARFFEQLAGPFPEDVPYVSIHSPSDGMVAAHASSDPAATDVEVDATHIGLVVGAAGQQAIEEALRTLPVRQPA